MLPDIRPSIRRVPRPTSRRYILVVRLPRQAPCLQQIKNGLLICRDIVIIVVGDAIIGSCNGCDVIGLRGVRDGVVVGQEDSLRRDGLVSGEDGYG